MSNILVYMNIVENGEYDIFHNTDRENMEQVVHNSYGGHCFNVGNKLWFQGIISAISTDNNYITYWNNKMTSDEINSQYDCILAPMANIFSAGYKQLLDHISERFEKYKIPIYVIACGVQADDYDHLDDLCAEIGVQAKRLMKSVYNTGGEFALRGYFTKEFFDRMGFKSAVVTGCPSLFQRGRDMAEKIELKEVDLHTFKVALNGQITDYQKIIEQTNNCAFFDQNVYFNLINEVYFHYNSFSWQKSIKSYGLPAISLLSRGRLKLFPDMMSWHNYLLNEGFDFSFGSRIHGNIMPILSGIPSLVVAKDSRTREMAEYFDIPILVENSEYSIEALYSLYQRIDYTAFKRSFGKRFDVFEDFLKKCGLVDKTNINNAFFSNKVDSQDILKNEYMEEILFEKYIHNKQWFSLYARLINIKRSIINFSNKPV